MKESFYFPHDYSARNDDKILCIREKYKNEGYAIFFYCLETMAERGDGYILPSLIGGLSLGYGVAKDWLITFLDYCVKIEAFQKDEKGYYYNPRMIKHLEYRKSLSEGGKKGAKIRWKNSPPNTPPYTKERKGKERKGKEIKINREREVVQSTPPPSQIMKEFINNINTQEHYITEISENTKTERLFILQEVKKFISYWTESTKSGHKQRWETEKTFELKRRLSNWFRNIKQFNNNQNIYGKVNTHN